MDVTHLSILPCKYILNTTEFLLCGLLYSGPLTSRSLLTPGRTPANRYAGLFFVRCGRVKWFQHSAKNTVSPHTDLPKFFFSSYWIDSIGNSQFWNLENFHSNGSGGVGKQYYTILASFLHFGEYLKIKAKFNWKLFKLFRYIQKLTVFALNYLLNIPWRTLTFRDLKWFSKLKLLLFFFFYIRIWLPHAELICSMKNKDIGCSGGRGNDKEEIELGAPIVLILSASWIQGKANRYIFFIYTYPFKLVV